MMNNLEYLASRVTYSDKDKDPCQLFISMINDRGSFIYNPNYDCYEIAEDFINTLNKGTVYKILSAEPNVFMGQFKGLELGNLAEYYDHFVYVHNAIAYDPRLYSKPIYWEDYKKFIQSINQVKLSYTKQ